MNVGEAAYTLRITRRRDGDAAIVYQTELTDAGKERLVRVAAIGPLTFAAARPMLHAAVRTADGPEADLAPGPSHPLSAKWGVRVVVYALIAAGLRDADRLRRAAEVIQHADSLETVWWLARLEGDNRARTIRALRILIQAVE